MYKHDFPSRDDERDLDDAWAEPVATVEANMRPQMPQVEERDESFLSIGDLNLKDLQKIGQLQIRWTPYWDEHLEIDSNRLSNTLKLYWFCPILTRYFEAKSVSSPDNKAMWLTISRGLCGGLSEHHRGQRAYEIASTMCLLLTSGCSEKEAKRRYCKLKAPPWLSLLAHSRLGTWRPEAQSLPENAPNLMSFRVAGEEDFCSFCFETCAHPLSQWSADGRIPQARIAYSEFPVYRERLRILREYMDHQQPKSFWALLMDKRNPHTYYTLLVAVVFGVLTILVGFWALIATILSTVAQMESHH